MLNHGSCAGFVAHVEMCIRRRGVAGSRPGERVPFFASPKKGTEKRRAGLVGPALCCGHAALLGSSGRRRNSPCGLRHLRLFFRLTLRYSPPHYGMAVNTTNRRTRTRHGESLWSSVLVFGSPRRYEEASSAGADGSGLALFEALAEFSQTPAAPSNAAYPRFARGDESGSPFFAYFLWRSKESECAVGRSTRHQTHLRRKTRQGRQPC